MARTMPRANHRRWLRVPASGCGVAILAVVALASYAEGGSGGQGVEGLNGLPMAKVESFLRDLGRVVRAEGVTFEVPSQAPFGTVTSHETFERPDERGFEVAVTIALPPFEGQALEYARGVAEASAIRVQEVAAPVDSEEAARRVVELQPSGIDGAIGLQIGQLDETNRGLTWILWAAAAAVVLVLAALAVYWFWPEDTVRTQGRREPGDEQFQGATHHVTQAVQVAGVQDLNRSLAEISRTLAELATRLDSGNQSPQLKAIGSALERAEAQLRTKPSVDQVHTIAAETVRNWFAPSQIDRATVASSAGEAQGSVEHSQQRSLLSQITSSYNDFRMKAQRDGVVPNPGFSDKWPTVCAVQEDDDSTRLLKVDGGSLWIMGWGGSPISYVFPSIEEKLNKPSLAELFELPKEGDHKHWVLDAPAEAQGIDVGAWRVVRKGRLKAN